MINFAFLQRPNFGFSVHSGGQEVSPLPKGQTKLGLTQVKIDTDLILLDTPPLVLILEGFFDS